MADVRLVYDGLPVQLSASSERDHILNDMRRRGTFYEVDVLEALRLLVRGRRGGAIDAGAYIGTHSVYFAKFCGLGPVVSFEANPSTYPLLVHNVKANGLDASIIPINKALGAIPGRAAVTSPNVENLGHTVAHFDSARTNGSVEVTTIDGELARMSMPVALLKIDVEGAELPVLDGAMRTIERERPFICIEVHNAANLRAVMGKLRGYWIVDCLGYSPTYILEPTSAPMLARRLLGLLWLARAAMPRGKFKLKRLLQGLTRALRNWPKRNKSHEHS